MVDRRFVAVSVALAFGLALLAGKWAVERRGGALAPDPAPPSAPAAPGAPPNASATAVWRVPVGSAPTEGAVDALVTIVLFTDLAPAGRRLQRVVEGLEAERRGDVRFAVRVLSNAATRQVAEALFAAHQQGKFLELQRRLGDRLPAGRPELDEAARQAGLDRGAFDAAITSGKPGRRADADMRLAAMLGLTAPTLFVNGVRVDGRATDAEIAKVVEAQKRRAEGIVRGGVQRAQVYAELTKNGRSNVVVPEGATATPRREDPEAVYHVDIDGAPVRGPADALVTIVELGDFQCPFCLRAEVALRELVERHAGDVRLVWRNSPLSSHPEGKPAAAAAMAANAQGKFWQMHDALFAAQRELGTATYERLARQLGLDLARFRADMAASGTNEAIAQEGAAAVRLGAIGTPVFFVNGKRLRGFRSPDALAELVDRELDRARKLVRDERVPRAEVFARLTRDGARQPMFLSTPGALPPGPHRAATVQDLRPSQTALPAPRAPVPPPQQP